MEKPDTHEEETTTKDAETTTPQAELRRQRAEFYRNRPGMGQSRLPEVVIEAIAEDEVAKEEGE